MQNVLDAIMMSFCRMTIEENCSNDSGNVLLAIDAFGDLSLSLLNKCYKQYISLPLTG